MFSALFREEAKEHSGDWGSSLVALQGGLMSEFDPLLGQVPKDCEEAAWGFDNLRPYRGLSSSPPVIG